MRFQKALQILAGIAIDVECFESAQIIWYHELTEFGWKVVTNHGEKHDMNEYVARWFWNPLLKLTVNLDIKPDTTQGRIARTILKKRLLTSFMNSADKELTSIEKRAALQSYRNLMDIVTVSVAAGDKEPLRLPISSGRYLLEVRSSLEQTWHYMIEVLCSQ